MKTTQQFPIVNGPPEIGFGFGFRITNEAKKDSAEIEIFDEIGKNWWDDSGTDAKSFADQLAAIKKENPKRALAVRINSLGGNVFDGIAITHHLWNWEGKVDTYNIGVAASIASVIMLGACNGGKVHSYRASQTMAHLPSTIGIGNKFDFRKAINALESCENSILSIYARKTGKTNEVLSQMMADETWFIGAAAKEYGFVDSIIDGEASPIKNNFDISKAGFKRVPEAFLKIQNSAHSGQQNRLIMTREEIIAMLKQHGITADANATIEQLKAQLTAALAAKKEDQVPAPIPEPSAGTNDTVNRLKVVEARLEAERTQRVENSIDLAISERRIPVAQRKSWVARVLADESLLVDIQAMHQNLPPAPVGPSSIQVGASFADIQSHIGRLGREIIKDIQNGENDASSDKLAVMKAKARSKAIRDNEAAIIQIWNEGTNTIDAQLQQDVIIDIGLRAYARVLSPISVFGTMFGNVPLRGTNKLQVPFLALDATTPTQWNAANGYVAGDTTNSNREVTIDNRYYLGVRFTSEEVARQPFLMIKEQMIMKAESLAFYVWKNFLALFTTANYDIATGWPKAAAAMDSNAIADLKKIADDLDWPMPGRQLFVNSAYDNALMKDNAFKLFINFGGSEVMRTGRLPNVYGFNYSANSHLEDNSINLAGIIATKAAALFATSPIPPTEEVLRDGTQYSFVIDPDTGIPLEYRSFGESKFDRSTRVVEANWGKGVGNASAAKLLTSA